MLPQSTALSRHARVYEPHVAGMLFPLLFLPDECHGECAYEHQLLAMNATVDFLGRHLLGRGGLLAKGGVR